MFLLRVCAWHPRLTGRRKVLGVKWARRLWPSFTHGICQECMLRIQHEVRRCSDGSYVNAA